MVYPNISFPKFNKRSLNSSISLVSTSHLCKLHIWPLMAFKLSQNLLQLRFKGTNNPKMKIQSLSTHPHADGRSNEVSKRTKRLWSFTAILLYNKTSGLVLKHNKTKLKICINGSIQLIWVSDSSEIPKWFEETLFTPVFSLNLHCGGAH